MSNQPSTIKSKPMTDSDETTRPSERARPIVVPAEPIPKSRKRPIPWDTDSGTDGDDSSMERLIKWLLCGDNFERWRKGVGLANEPITKKALSDEFLEKLQNAGIDYRKTADVQTKVYQLENDFEKTRQWLATIDATEDGSTHGAKTRETVLQRCKYYYRLEPVFGEFIPFSKELPTRRTNHRQQSKSSTPPVNPSTIAPSLTHQPISPRVQPTAPQPIQPMLGTQSFKAAFTAFAEQLQQSIATPQPPLQTVADLSTPAPGPSTEPSRSFASPFLPPTINNAPAPTCYSESEQEKAIKSNERVAMEHLRLAEKKHDDRMGLKKRKLELLDSRAIKDLDIKKRKATAEILTAHAQLISELRSLGLPNDEIVDYMKKAEKL